MTDNELNQRRAQKKVIAMAIVFVVAGIAYWHYAPSLTLKNLIELQGTVEDRAISEVQKQFAAPPPLRVTPSPAHSTPTESPSTLTRAGIITETNIQRKENGGLPALSENTKLDEIALLRTRDMFKKQYFAHVAPDGGSAQVTAKTVGYDYLALGENLALGVFSGDKDVVEAWMNSPGHRANILNSHYTEIGVAAEEGIYEGRITWIAVQIFGRPAADCPAPDASLKKAIDDAEAQLAAMEDELAAKKADLDATEPKRGPAYNEKVNEYNNLVSSYNALVKDTKSKMNTYNKQADAYNACIAE